MGKPVSISAMSSCFTIAYQLRKADFREVLATSMRDYEGVCELRDRFLGRSLLESI